MSAVMLSGLFVGMVYGLTSVGLVVAYRGSRVINFAHGEIGMIGAFVFADLRHGSSDPLFGLSVDHGIVWPLIAGVGVAAALGALTELGVVRPLRTAPRIQPLVGTLAVASVLFTFAVRRWGTDARFAQPLLDGDGILVGGLQIQAGQLLIAAVSAAILLGLAVVYRCTRAGLRLRATALDPYGAGLVGVNVNLTSLATWTLAGALAGAAAILVAPLVAFDVTFMTTLSIRGLAAALLGGLTNVSGAFGAGLVLGVAEAVITYKSPVAGITDVVVATAIVIMLLARPTGVLRSNY
jgi:branched-chain amino acid transport system permease protein